MSVIMNDLYFTFIRDGANMKRRLFSSRNLWYILVAG